MRVIPSSNYTAQLFDYPALVHQSAKSRGVFFASLALSLGLITGALTVESKSLKFGLMSLAAGSTLIARVSGTAHSEADRNARDIGDIATTARDQVLFRGMTEAGAAAVPTDGPVVSMAAAPVEGIDTAVLLPSGDSAIAPSEELPFYDLSQIAGENHLGVVGASGAGKTYLTQYLVGKYFDTASEVVAMDTDAKPGDWPGLKVVGKGGNVRKIQAHMNKNLAELDKRTKLNSVGSPVGGEIVSIIEECPTVTADVQREIDYDHSLRVQDAKLAKEPTPIKEPNTCTDWLLRILRRGRKYKMAIILVSQSFNARSLKIEGEADILENLSIIYLGGKAYKQLSRIKDKALKAATKAWMDSQDRPALIDVGGVLMRFEVPNIPVNYFSSIAPVDSQIEDDWDEGRYGDVGSFTASMPKRMSAPGATSVVHIQPTQGGNIDMRQLLHSTIAAMLAQGLTKTQIIKKVWNKPGTKYTSAKEAWQKLEDDYGALS